MRLTVRPATLDDLPVVVEIYNQAIRSGNATGDMTEFSVEERRGWYEEFDVETFPLFVAELKGIVIGYISLSPYRRGRRAFSDVAEVSFFVDYSHHGKGVGRTMMQHMIRMARQTGKRVLLAILLEVNVPSIALLGSSGFTKWGHLPDIGNFDGKYIGQFIFGLDLTRD